MPDFRRNGVGGNFYGEMHTAEYMRKEVWTPEIFTHMKPSEYNQGKKNVLERATEKVKEILSIHNPHPLSEKQEEEIQKIVKKAEQEKGVKK